MDTEYLYCLVPHDAPEGECGQVEALLLMTRTPAEWMARPEGRIYRMKVEHVGPASRDIMGYKLVTFVGELPPHLVQGWTQLVRAFGTVPRDAVEEAGPEALWSVTAQSLSNRHERHERHGMPIQEAVHCYGEAVQNYIYDEGEVRHWQPRRTEGVSWSVSLDGPREPLP